MVIDLETPPSSPTVPYRDGRLRADDAFRAASVLGEGRNEGRNERTQARLRELERLQRQMDHERTQLMDHERIMMSPVSTSLAGQSLPFPASAGPAFDWRAERKRGRQPAGLLDGLGSRSRVAPTGGPPVDPSFSFSPPPPPSGEPSTRLASILNACGPHLGRLFSGLSSALPSSGTLAVGEEQLSPLLFSSTGGWEGGAAGLYHFYQSAQESRAGTNLARIHGREDWDRKQPLSRLVVILTDNMLSKKCAKTFTHDRDGKPLRRPVLLVYLGLKAPLANETKYVGTLAGSGRATKEVPSPRPARSRRPLAAGIGSHLGLLPYRSGST